MIVVVINGEARGNLPGTITQVLSKPGEVSDSVTKHYNITSSKNCAHKVFCEDKRWNTPSKLFNNKPALYELISDLRPATEKEKDMLRAGIENIYA